MTDVKEHSALSFEKVLNLAIAWLCVCIALLLWYHLDVVTFLAVIQFPVFSFAL
jgi:hypothetical protein